MKPLDPPSAPRSPIKLGKTEDGEKVVIRPDGRLFVGEIEIEPESPSGVVSADGKHTGLGGETIRRFVIDLQRKSLKLRHVTRGESKWWDVDDVGMQADGHAENLWVRN